MHVVHQVLKRLLEASAAAAAGPLLLPLEGWGGRITAGGCRRGRGAKTILRVLLSLLPPLL